MVNVVRIITTRWKETWLGTNAAQNFTVPFVFTLTPTRVELNVERSAPELRPPGSSGSTESYSGSLRRIRMTSLCETDRHRGNEKFQTRFVPRTVDVSLSGAYPRAEFMRNTNLRERDGGKIQLPRSDPARRRNSIVETGFIFDSNHGVLVVAMTTNRWRGLDRSAGEIRTIYRRNFWGRHFLEEINQID